MSDNVITLDFSRGKKDSEVVPEPVAVVDENGPFNYQAIIEKNQLVMMQNVMRDILTDVQTHGLIDNHHFYITFDTQINGVRCPKHYKDDLTIVLENQFSELEVTDTGFSVVLSFNQVQSLVVVPWNAIVKFSDPSVNLVFELVQR